MPTYDATKIAKLFSNASLDEIINKNGKKPKVDLPNNISITYTTHTFASNQVVIEDRNSGKTEEYQIDSKGMVWYKQDNKFVNASDQQVEKLANLHNQVLQKQNPALEISPIYLGLPPFFTPNLALDEFIKFINYARIYDIYPDACSNAELLKLKINVSQSGDSFVEFPNYILYDLFVEYCKNKYIPVTHQKEILPTMEINFTNPNNKPADDFKKLSGTQYQFISGPTIPIVGVSTYKLRVPISDHTPVRQGDVMFFNIWNPVSPYAIKVGPQHKLVDFEQGGARISSDEDKKRHLTEVAKVIVAQMAKGINVVGLQEVPEDIALRNHFFEQLQEAAKLTNGKVEISKEQLDVLDKQNFVRHMQSRICTIVNNKTVKSVQQANIPTNNMQVCTVTYKNGVQRHIANIHGNFKNPQETEANINYARQNGLTFGGDLNLPNCPGPQDYNYTIAGNTIDVAHSPEYQECMRRMNPSYNVANQQQPTPPQPQQQPVAKPPPPPQPVAPPPPPVMQQQPLPNVQPAQQPQQPITPQTAQVGVLANNVNALANLSAKDNNANKETLKNMLFDVKSAMLMAKSQGKSTEAIDCGFFIGLTRNGFPFIEAGNYRAQVSFDTGVPVFKMFEFVEGQDKPIDITNQETKLTTAFNCFQNKALNPNQNPIEDNKRSVQKLKLVNILEKLEQELPTPTAEIKFGENPTITCGRDNNNRPYLEIGYKKIVLAGNDLAVYQKQNNNQDMPIPKDFRQYQDTIRGFTDNIGKVNSSSEDYFMRCLMNEVHKRNPDNRV
ncbi:MAG: hypothetical protein A3F18_02020 [Legionellales bacterium RIFCSPHIGHO2_12_FULL_37_14]|nr:MAG: hypothetical protein A3F18_02020 [Legionellales bacterium RIFCSPHIGHO2_12_FULL_37_14]